MSPLLLTRCGPSQDYDVAGLDELNWTTSLHCAALLEPTAFFQDQEVSVSVFAQGFGVGVLEGSTLASSLSRLCCVSRWGHVRSFSASTTVSAPEDCLC